MHEELENAKQAKKQWNARLQHLPKEINENSIPLSEDSIAEDCAPLVNKFDERLT